MRHSIPSSPLLLSLGVVSPNGLNAAFELMQAAAVGVFALRQWASLRPGAAADATAVGA